MNLNDKPTTDQLEKLLQACDDAAGPYVVWVDQRGEVQIALFTNQIPATAVHGIVETNCAHDELFIATLFEKIMRGWKDEKRVSTDSSLSSLSAPAG